MSRGVDMLHLEGKIINNKFNILNKVGEGRLSTVWLAEDIDKQEVLALKFIHNNAISNRLEDLIRFRTEISMVSKLNSQFLVKVYETGVFEDEIYISMEYVGDKSLKELFHEGFKFNPENAVDLIVKLCGALELVHKYNVVHRDIIPANILVGYDLDGHIIDTKINDFGIGQVKEYDLKNADEVIESLSFMSPEQISAVNIYSEQKLAIKKSVDERSDLYSLGVLLYRLLVGRLPFKTENINSIIFYQRNVVPERLTKYEDSIPAELEQIVFKLLEKVPEKRYQSVSSLLSDLKQYKNRKLSVLGLEDNSIKLNFKTELVGRENEINELISQYDSVLTGKGSMILITGDAGVGKTRIAEEFKHYVLGKKGMVIEGRCFSEENGIPYSTIRDALNSYSKHFKIKYTGDNKKDVGQKIKNSVEDLGEIIIKLCPQMKEIIGKCIPLIRLESDKENKRFLSVVSQFLFGLGEVENPLIMIIDDLQWADRGTISLLSEIVKGINEYPLLIIGIYNTQQKTSNGIDGFLSDFKNSSYPVSEIELKPFDKINMNRYIYGLLYGNEEDSDDFIQFIMEKSQGNPLLAMEILRQLIDEKVVSYLRQKWCIDENALKLIEVPTTIADILVRKIHHMDEREVNVLSHASVIGKKFDIGLLFGLVELKNEDIVKVIDKAIALQLLEEDTNEKGKISFAHDRIKDVFYRNMENIKRQNIHLKIAQKIETTEKGENEKLEFDLVYHYIEIGDKNKILEYAYPAGMKAWENYAYDEALKYLLLVKEILEERGNVGNDRWKECMVVLGEIYSILGKNTESAKIYTTLLQYTVSKLERVNVFKQISIAYFKMGDWKNCEAYGKQGLKLVGETLPDEKSDITISVLKETMVHLMHHFFSRFYSSHQDASMCDEEKCAAWIYYVLSWSYSMSGNFTMFKIMVLKMLNLSERKVDRSRELGLSLMVYAVYLMEIPHFKASIKYLNRSLEMRRILNDEWGIAQSLKSIGFYYKNAGQFRESITCLKESMSLFKKIGDVAELEGAVSGLAINYMNLADYQDAKVMNERYYEMCVQSRDNVQIALSWSIASLYYMEMGDYNNAEVYGTKSNTLAIEIGDSYVGCVSYITLGRVFLEKGNIEEAVNNLEKAKELFEKNRLLKELTTALYPFLAEAYVSEFLINKQSINIQDKKKYLEKIKKACNESIKQTKLWVNFHMCALRVCAKYEGLIGNMKKSEKLFLKSIKLARDLERKYEMAVNLLEYGKFLKEIGEHSKSKMNIERAYATFREIDSVVYMQCSKELLK